MDLPEALSTFLRRLESEDGYPPLSEAKVVSMGNPDRFVTVEDDASIVAVGAAAEHATPSGQGHWSIETAVDGSLRFKEFEEAVLDRALSLVPSAAQHTVWSRRTSLDAALESAGFEALRSLANMEVPLPLESSEVAETTPMGAGAEQKLIAINALSFAGHPEAASLDREELAVLMAQGWFDREGVRFHESGEGVDAFCWTKVHPGGIGEIYRIGVAPGAQGQGLGRSMVVAGFDYLQRERGCRLGRLWVDESNEAAMRLYKSLDMETLARNREFVRR